MYWLEISREMANRRYEDEKEEKIVRKLGDTGTRTKDEEG